MTKKEPIPEIRQRPAKSDKELFEEYFGLEGHDWYAHITKVWVNADAEPVNPPRCRLCNAIEKELGIDKINAERIRRLEERVKECERPKRTTGSTGALAVLVICVGAILHGFYHLAACFAGFGPPAFCALS